MSNLNYYISCEGETEEWYFEWLQTQINNDSRTKNKVTLNPHKGRTPTDYAKSIRGAYVAQTGRCKTFYRVQDIEDYSDEHIEKLHELCANTKKAKSITNNCEFAIAYSNFTFEVWIIAHKSQVPTVIDRSKYYEHINRAFGFKFKDNDEYKKEDNFKKLLKTLTLDDVINHALQECEKIRSNNEAFYKDCKRQYMGLTYFLQNPDTNIDVLIRDILKGSGII
ncbi:MAG: RloB family protein [Roseburia sp.]|nr:RloB family protein [Roseburia sp.]